MVLVLDFPRKKNPNESIGIVDILEYGNCQQLLRELVPKTHLFSCVLIFSRSVTMVLFGSDGGLDDPEETVDPPSFFFFPNQFIAVVVFVVGC